MPLTISWQIQDRVILIINHGSVMREDMVRGSAIMIDMMDRATSSRVHVLSDVSRMRNVPDLQSLSQQNWVEHDKLGWLGVIGEVPEELRIALNVLSKARRVKTFYAANVEEGMTFLYEHDPSLPRSN